MSFTFLWLIIAVVCIGSELLLTQFILLFFGIGALVAMLTSFFTNSLSIMLVVFSVVSLGMLIFFRSRVVSYVGRMGKQNISNKIYDGTQCPYIGHKALVTRAINSEESKVGEVEVGGSYWSATSLSDTLIPKNAEVTVEGWQENNHLILIVK